MLDKNDVLLFAALSEAEREENERHADDWLESGTECEPTNNYWDDSAPRESDNSESDWYHREREQAEWEMRNADFYDFDKDGIQQRLDYLKEKEDNLE